MPAIHSSASQGYAAAAGTYAAGRPGYPAEAVAWLRDVVGLHAGRTALDLGAGTGKFLPYLRETGAALVAVEPVDAMRQRLADDNPDVRALAGAAERIPLPDASVDAVVCAQAFHWFANHRALMDIRRVLKPGGVLGLIWNVRDERVGWVAALTAITDAYEGDTPRYRTGRWRALFPALGFECLGERHFAHGHTGDPEQVIVERALSTSFIAALPADGRAAVAAKIRALIAATPALAGRAEVTFPYETAAFAWRRTDRATPR